MDFAAITPESFPSRCRTCLIEITGIKYDETEMPSSVLELFSLITGYRKLQKGLYPDGLCEKCFIILKNFEELKVIALKHKQFLEISVKAFQAASRAGKTQTEENRKHSLNIKKEIPEQIVLKVEPDLYFDELNNEENKNEIVGSMITMIDMGETSHNEIKNEYDEIEGNEMKNASSSKGEGKSAVQSVIKLASKSRIGRTCEYCDIGRKCPQHVCCDICGYQFSSPDSLKRHVMVVHEGIKPHRCKYCDQAFSTASHCRLHERRHTGEKPHICSKCGRSFAQPGALRVHMKSHEPKPKKIKKK